MKIGDRVELHPSMSRWMMGDRFGDIEKINAKAKRIKVKLDKSGKSIWVFESNVNVID